MNTLQTLVVDANPSRREALLASLRRFGLTPESCSSGEEALARFEPGAFHLVLIDGRLPGLDLYDTATAIRNREAHANHGFIPAHLVAAFPQIDLHTRRQAFAFDINLCLRRPFPLRSLHTVLERVVHFRKHLSSSPPSAPHAGPAVDGELLNALLLEEAGERETLVALVDLFLSNIPPLLRHYNEALQQADDRAIRVISRKLQGSCLSVGAHGVIHLCEQILSARRKQNSPEGFRFLLNEEFTRVVSRLHHLREQEAGGQESQEAVFFGEPDSAFNQASIR